MAARENQGYLIAVIILVLLTLVLALVCFFGLSKASENADNAASLEAQLNSAKNLVAAKTSEVEIFRSLVGGFENSIADVEVAKNKINQLSGSAQGNEKTGIDEVVKNVETLLEFYEKDMLGNISVDGQPPVQQPTWRELVRSLTAIIAKKNSLLSTQVNVTQKSEEDKATQIANKDAELAALTESLDQLKATKADDDQRYLETLNELKSSLAKAGVDIEDLNKDLQAQRQTSAEELSKKENELKDTREQLASARTQLNRITRENFDSPDGRIVGVSTRLRSVRIDLGRDHGLQNSQTFGVYDQDVTNFETDSPKAKIQVTRVFDSYSTAKITEESPTVPILRGDHILTASWDPGFSEKFAVAGSFFIDGDIFDDRDQVIQAIKDNGGEVVATHNEKGEISGTIDQNVRFLVVGEVPKTVPDEDPTNAQGIADAIIAMTAEAERNTIQIISAQKLYSKLGIRAQPRVRNFVDRTSGFPSRSDVIREGSGSKGSDSKGSDSKGSDSKAGSGTR